MRNAEEVCVEIDSEKARCDLVGDSEQEEWETITSENITIQELTIDGVTVLEASLEFTRPHPLCGESKYNRLIPLAPWPLYRVEVQAVIADSSDWSDFVLVFPTSEPPGGFTRVATNGFNGEYQEKRNGSHEYRYTLCKGTITAAVAWGTGDLVRDDATVAAIATDIKAGIEGWEKAVRWVTGDASIISVTATESETCTDSDSNTVEFIPNIDVEEDCDNPLALGCVPQGTSSILLRHTPKGYNSLKADYEDTSWDVMRGSCSMLHQVVLHEAGHVFGFVHSSTRQSVMYGGLADWRTGLSHSAYRRCIMTP